ncbi:hypothetical protein LMA04_00490 [Pseudescherichia vulneris]|nr:hypothetical protein [Pseudescherichia vulneris]WAH52573.1 hypothetical protein LMA04_00490 [Pseudescherichia vulneris]
MEIVVKVSKEELAEVGMTPEELKNQVIDDLNRESDYPGFNVTVEVE